MANPKACHESTTQNPNLNPLSSHHFGQCKHHGLLSLSHISHLTSKMLSMTIQSGIYCTFSCSPFRSKKPTIKTSEPSIFLNTKASSVHSSPILDKRTKPTSRNQRLSVSAAPEALTAETPTEPSTSSAPPEPIPTQENEKVEVMVKKQMERPRLVLKFKWMEKNIGLALDQVIPGYGTVPLSPYFFWPRKDAWEELKATLESKPWISQKKIIILLNQATDIINLWQQSGGNLS